MIYEYYKPKCLSHNTAQTCSYWPCGCHYQRPCNNNCNYPCGCNNSLASWDNCNLPIFNMPCNSQIKENHCFAWFISGLLIGQMFK